ncbi:hypothetical protein Tco_0444359 [Tanacetum coccineum]
MNQEKKKKKIDVELCRVCMSSSESWLLCLMVVVEDVFDVFDEECQSDVEDVFDESAAFMSNGSGGARNASLLEDEDYDFY